jgi:putative redox protein
VTTTNTRQATLDWTEGMVFQSSDSRGHSVMIDGASETAPSPITTLLFAIGACSGADIVTILGKARVKLTRFRIEVSGTRRHEFPRRFTDLTLKFTFAGEGLTEANTQRAVQLSMEKYCSVVATLDPEMPIGTEIVIEPGP